MTTAQRTYHVSILAILSLLAAWTPTSARAETLEFDCKDPKGVHAISFLLDAPLEPIMGLATGISGKVRFDPEHPEKTTGTIICQADSVETANKKMTEYLHAPSWLDVETYPTIEFTIKEVKRAKKIGGNRYELAIVGDFTCRGVTKELNVPVLLTYLPDMLAKRQRGGEGDLMVIRSEFSILRSDFGIKPDTEPLVVSNEIELRVALVGTHQK